MDDITREKIARMTRLARPFLWNLCPTVYKNGRIEGEPKIKNSSMQEYAPKDATYIWLQKNDFDVDGKDNYEIWVNHICDEYGVEQVFKRLVIPELKRRIGPGTMDELRQWWMNCRIPDRRFVKEHDRKYKLDLKKDAGAVLEIHFRFGYVHRFGPLAPIIFEDAAEWLKEDGLLSKLS